MDYNYTSTLEQEIEQVETGTKQWTDIVHAFYTDFEPVVRATNKKYKENPNFNKHILGTLEDDTIVYA